MQVKAEVAEAAGRSGRRRERWLQIEMLRIIAIVAVVATHVVIYSQSSTAVGPQALTVLLHVSRFVFFFITAFVLYLTAGQRSVRLLPFWRKRFPPVLIPYLVWTLIYWQYNRFFPWGGYPGTFSAALGVLAHNLLNGWFQLYFLIVTFQLYIAFPLIAWIVRRTRGYHWHLLIVTGVLQTAWFFCMQYLWWVVPSWIRDAFGHAQMELWTYTFFFFLGAVAAAHRDQLVAALRRYPWRLAVLALALLGGAYALFGLNLWLGDSPAQAANVFQPGTVLAVLGALLGLGLIAQHLADAHSPQSAVWRFFRWGGEISFGIYLSHMVALQLVTLLEVNGLLGLHLLPTAIYGVVLWVATVAGTMLLVSVLRYLPLSTALTGRPRRPLPALRRTAVSVEQRSA